MHPGLLAALIIHEVKIMNTLTVTAIISFVLGSISFLWLMDCSADFSLPGYIISQQSEFLMSSILK